MAKPGEFDAKCSYKNNSTGTEGLVHHKLETEILSLKPEELTHEL